MENIFYSCFLDWILKFFVWPMNFRPWDQNLWTEIINWAKWWSLVKVILFKSNKDCFKNKGLEFLPHDFNSQSHLSIVVQDLFFIISWRHIFRMYISVICTWTNWQKKQCESIEWLQANFIGPQYATDSYFVYVLKMEYGWKLRHKVSFIICTMNIELDP